MRLLTAVMLFFVCLVTPFATADELTGRESHALGQICLRCHAQPNVAAPLIGDVDAWRPRVSQGLDVMLEKTVLGYGEMPPLGTCGYCSEDELRTLIRVVSGSVERESEDAR